MNYLLDTHTFIWLDNDPDKLSENVKNICRDQSNVLLLSLVSVWEMQIKHQLGKLELPAPLAEVIKNQVDTNNIQLLKVELPHILSLEQLPAHHKDPFDRLLISQAIHENLVFITNDSHIPSYPVLTVW